MSFTATLSILTRSNSDAEFRAWGSAFGTKFTSAGWVQTADTGQINWTTVTAAAGTNSSQGYEIWKFNDALQSTAPVYMKWEYGSGNPNTAPSLWITLGSGSDGAGSLTGLVSVRQQMSFGSTAASITSYWSGDTNRLTVAMPSSSASNSFLFAIERSVDTAGVVSSEAVLRFWHSSGAWAQIAWNTTIGPPGLVETSLGCLGPATAPLGLTGSQIAVYPIYHNKGVFYNPGLNGFSYFNATITALATITFTVYSGSHSYLPLGNTTAFTVTPFRGGASGGSLMIRYE